MRLNELVDQEANGVCVRWRAHVEMRVAKRCISLGVVCFTGEKLTACGGENARDSSARREL